MTLQKKTLGAILLTSAALLVGLYFASQRVLEGSFSQLENQELRDDLARVRGMLDDNLASLEGTTRDWSIWDDTYAYVQDHNQNYYNSNLAEDATMANNQLNLMVFVDSQAHIVFAKAFDYNAGKELPIPHGLQEQIYPGSPLLQHPNANSNSSIKGFLSLPDVPLLIASEPILPSEGEGLVEGTLIFGRLLDKNALQHLAKTTAIGVTLQALDDPQMSAVSPDFKQALATLTETSPISIRPLDQTTIAGYDLLNDVYSKPALILSVDTERAVYAQGQKTIQYFLYVLAAAGVVFGLVIMIVMRRLVLARLARLKSEVSGIAASKGLLARVTMDGSDELSSLAGSVNDMLTELNRAREEQKRGQEVFFKAFQANPVLQILTSLADQRIIAVNDACLPLTGFSKEELTDHATTDLSTWLEPADRLVLAQTLREQGGISNMELVVRTKVGKTLSLLYSAVPMEIGGEPCLLSTAIDITQRIEAEEALKANQGQLTGIIASAMDAIITVDKEQQIVIFNSAAEKMFGYTAEEVVGRRLDMLIPERFREAHALYVDRFMHTSATSRTMLSLGSITGLRANGEEFPIEASISQITPGAQTLLTVILRDITERTKAEEALRLSAEILKRVGSLVMVADRDGSITYAGPSVETILGYKPEELLGDGWWRLTNSEGANRLNEKNRIMSEAKGEIAVLDKPYERAIMAKDGTPYSILWQDTRGPGEQIIGIGQDITDRKKAEESLRQSEERFRLMFASNPLPMWVYDIESLRFLEVNEAAVAHYGYSKDEFLSMTITDIRPLDEIPRLLENLTRSRPPLQQSGEWRHQTKAGQIIDVQITSHTFQFGEHSAALVVAQDVTERKKMEEARLAAEAAEQANRAKSEFLSRMSHELRTPLNSILGFSQLLQMTELSPKQSRNLNYVVAGGQHLLELINEVLDIARIESGHSGISLEPVDLQEALRECLDLITPMAAQRNVSIQTDDTLEHPRHVMADRQRLRQVLLNIMTNAVKYNRDGGSVSLSCEEVRRTKDGDQLRIRISDTGPGISSDKLAKVFTPFERLGAEQTDIEGTGLGLTLSRNLVEAMNGTIGVESAVGQGSTFWVGLNIVESPIQQLEKQQSGPISETLLAGTARTVLYVEDNLPNVKLVEGILEKMQGIKLLTAMQGMLAIETARHEQLDLILLDLHLPDMMGDEVLRRLKNDPRTCSIPVVVISADATQAQLEELRAAGAQEYLTKPISIKAFLRVLDEILIRGRQNLEGKVALP